MSRGIYVNGHLIRCSIRCIRARRDECECKCHAEHHQGKGIPAGADVSGKAPRLLPSFFSGRRRRERQRQASEYGAYLESRLSDAEAETRGNLVTEEGERRGITGRSFFTSGKLPPMRYASDELRDWFASNGPILTASEYREQATDTRDEDEGAYGHLGYP